VSSAIGWSSGIPISQEQKKINGGKYDTVYPAKHHKKKSGGNCVSGVWERVEGIMFFFLV